MHVLTIMFCYICQSCVVPPLKICQSQPWQLLACLTGILFLVSSGREQGQGIYMYYVYICLTATIYLVKKKNLLFIYLWFVCNLEIRWNYFYCLAPILVVSTTCIDPRVLELVIWNNQWDNCISLNFNFHG